MRKLAKQTEASQKSSLKHNGRRPYHVAYLTKHNPGIERMFAFASHQNSPKSLHKNMKGTSSGCPVRAFTLSSSSFNSCGDQYALVCPLDAVYSIAEGSSSFLTKPAPVASLPAPSPAHVSSEWIRGLSKCRYLQSTNKYRTDMPIGYTFPAATQIPGRGG